MRIFAVFYDFLGRKVSCFMGAKLQLFFTDQNWKFSANLGLLGDMNALTVAGDGTPIVKDAMDILRQTRRYVYS